MKIYSSKEIVKGGLIESIEGVTIMLEGEKDPVMVTSTFIATHEPSPGKMYMDSSLTGTGCMTLLEFNEIYEEIKQAKPEVKKPAKKPAKKATKPKK